MYLPCLLSSRFGPTVAKVSLNKQSRLVKRTTLNISILGSINIFCRFALTIMSESEIGNSVSHLYAALAFFALSLCSIYVLHFFTAWRTFVQSVFMNKIILAFLAFFISMFRHGNVHLAKYLLIQGI